MGKKKFIDKKKSATFQLLARDSSDPYYNDTPGSDRVFVRVDNNPFSGDTFFADDTSGNVHCDGDPNSIFADAPEDIDGDSDDDDKFLGFSKKLDGRGGASGAFPEHVRREILELGFPDDGYNYLIHLREIKNTGGGSAFYHNPKARLDQLPRDVKAYDASRVRVSGLEGDDMNYKSIYGVASKAVGVRVQKVVDPDVSAFLEDGDLSRFGSDDEDLEEDFVIRANLPEEVDTDKELKFIDESEVINGATSEYVSSGGQENVVEHGGVEKVGNFLIEGRDEFVGEKPRVQRDLDDRFDVLEFQEYGTDDEDDQCGGCIAINNDSLVEELKQNLDNLAMDDLELDDEYKVPADILHGNERQKSKESSELAADIVLRCAEYAKKYENEDEYEDVTVVQESSDESEGWDCETIVSTYSNLDNHPAKIGAPETARKKLADTFPGALNANSRVISLHGKEKLPLDFLPSGRKSATAKAKGVPNLKTEPQKRKQHGLESKDEKKERKAAVKEERREARRVKKEMKGLYQCEAKRAQKVAAEAGPSSIPLM